ncbi:MAG: MFS transporter [Chloroflexi bacterium]|nr:MFS transporter [Chloroflexota bacterium]
MGTEMRQAFTLGCAWLAALNARAPLLAIGPLLPLVIGDLGLSFTVAGILSGLPLLLMGATGLPGGWLTDRIGARAVMIWCLAGITVAGVVRALAPSGAVLLAGTVLLGVAIGTLQPALPRVARDTLPHRTPLATAIYFNGLVVGGAAGVALTPLLVDVVGGWRGVLLGWAAVGAVASVGWIALRPARPVQLHKGRLRVQDIRDALTLPGMAALTLAMGTQSAIFYTFSAWAPTYLVSRGWSIAAATLPIASLPLASVVFSAMAGPAEARFGRRAVIAASGGIVALGLTVFIIWPDQTVLLSAIAIGAGTTWAFAVCMAAPAALAPAHRVGITAGVLLALGYGESAIGPAAIGSLRDAFGSYEAGWLLVLGQALMLTLTALGIPGRTRARLTPDRVEGTPGRQIGRRGRSCRERDDLLQP